MKIKTLSVLFTEGRVTLEQPGCVDGMVRLIFDGVKTVQYTWGGVDLAGAAMSSTAVLERQ